MISVFKSLKQYNFLLSQLVKKDIKLKYRSSYLGIIWTLLEPLLTMMVLTFVFSSLLGKGGEDYPVYILSGRLLFTAFSGATTAGLKSVRKHASMIKKVYVPKYMYPLAAVLSNYIMFLISLIVLIAVTLVRKVYPTFYIFEAIVPLLTLFLLCLGVGLILSTVAVFFRDIEYLWSVVIMVIMYASAIFYRAESVLTDKNQYIFKLNPLYGIIENFRNAIFGRPMELYFTIYPLVFAVLSLVVGAWAFAKNEEKFILHL